MNVKEAQDEMKEQPDNNTQPTKRSLPLKDESSLASEMNDATLVGSIHEQTILESSTNALDYADERYDKFNEMVAFPLGHSISRSKMPPLGPLIPLPSSSGSSSSAATTNAGSGGGVVNNNNSAITRQRAPPQSFAQKLRLVFIKFIKVKKN